ncbi:MAG: UDP-glucose 4-epimerase GalE [Stackebrandtia sp.]
MSWLVTGGAGYIGSHVVHRMRATNHKVVVYDDLSAGSAARIPDDVPLCVGNLLDRSALAEAMRVHNIEGVVNLAARKSVPESTADPLRYYRENLGGFITVLDAMNDAGVRHIVQSSSAAIYGGAPGPVHGESTLVEPLSPYATTKLMAEHVLRDIAAAGSLSYLALRYFNPVGAASPELAEVGGTNVFSILFDAIDTGEVFGVTGDDFDTRDGSGLRDYIHVEDLAAAHVAAVDYVLRHEGGQILNIGTGRGYTVFEMLEAVRDVTGLPVPHKVVDRRPGDPAGAVAAVDRAEALLDWRAGRDLREMVSSAWTMWRRQREPRVSASVSTVP